MSLLPNNSLEPTLLAGEKLLRVLPLSGAKMGQVLREASGGSARAVRLPVVRFPDVG